MIKKNAKHTYQQYLDYVLQLLTRPIKYCFSTSAWFVFSKNSVLNDADLYPLISIPAIPFGNLEIRFLGALHKNFNVVFANSFLSENCLKWNFYHNNIIRKSLVCSRNFRINKDKPKIFHCLPNLIFHSESPYMSLFFGGIIFL